MKPRASLTHRVEVRPLGVSRRSIRSSARSSVLLFPLTPTQPNDPPGSQSSRRFIEICTKHTEDNVSDSDESDRYEDDEEEGLPQPGGFPEELGMRVGHAPRSHKDGKAERRFEQADYETLGGVCWQLLTKLKSRTRFTNSEIRKEGVCALSEVLWVGGTDACCSGSDLEASGGL